MNPIFAVRAIEIGAKGYVSKSGVPYDLVRPFPAKWLRRNIPAARNRPKHRVRRPFVDPEPLSKLTSRGSKILVWLSAGKSLFRDRVLVHSSYKTIRQ